MNDQPRENGLTSEEVALRQARHGPNRLPEPKTPGPALIFARQFLSPFIYILMVAAAVSLFLGQLPSAVFICAVLLLNAAIGTVQEYTAARTASALRRMVTGSAHVIRDGVVQTVPMDSLVPGDVVLLYSGNRVPADIELTGSRSLQVDQSMLTGESVAVTKTAGAPVAPDAPTSERVDFCFAGTIVVGGRGQGIVRKTGLDTEIGGIATEVSGRRVSEPPLMIRIRAFTYQVGAAILIAIAALAGLMWLRGGYDSSEMMMMGIGLAVSTIPEGLPAALTVALAIGMRRMVHHAVIIRKLAAVEALGSCTFICSDKTGTLTVNELTVRRAMLPDGASYRVTGEGVRPGGHVEGEELERLRELCVTGILANESFLDYSGGEWVSDGDIVDVAFLVFAKKLGFSLSDVRDRQHRIDLIPYESERAFSGSLNRVGDEQILHVKGSPELMLHACTQMQTANGVQPIDRNAIETQFLALARQGYRIIALARRPAAPSSVLEDLGGRLDREVEGMTFLGMVAMIDPIRPEAAEAVARCRRGGVDVAMVTGDHPATARSIARELGLIGDGAPVVTGAEIRSAPAGEERAALIRQARVFARIEPLQKQEIVESFMSAGHFVAVTGDGVNDAPAMARANTGIAMGRTGTDVAKEIADLIITDDNFASIIDGIEQGRIVYNNIRKVIALLIATGFSALLLFFLTVVAGLPMPLIAVQLLWLNLIANGLQDVALAFEPKEGNELDRPPRSPTEPIFERRIVEHVLITGTVMGVLAFATYYVLLSNGTDLPAARNLVLMLMVLMGNIHALNSRSETISLFRMRFFANPFLILAVPLAQGVHIAAMYTPGLSHVLQLQPISLAQWGALLLVALILLVVEEGHKAWIRHRADTAKQSRRSP